MVVPAIRRWSVSNGAAPNLGMAMLSPFANGQACGSELAMLPSAPCQPPPRLFTSHDAWREAVVY